MPPDTYEREQYRQAFRHYACERMRQGVPDAPESAQIRAARVDEVVDFATKLANAELEAARENAVPGGSTDQRLDRAAESLRGAHVRLAEAERHLER